MILVDAYNETWTRKKTLPSSEFMNSTYPARRFGHAMASGSSFIIITDAESQQRPKYVDRIVMFGGSELYK